MRKVCSVVKKGALFAPFQNHVFAAGLIKSRTCFLSRIPVCNFDAGHAGGFGLIRTQHVSAAESVQGQLLTNGAGVDDSLGSPFLGRL